jgi:hypothetical protein
LTNFPSLNDILRLRSQVDLYQPKVNIIEKPELMVPFRLRGLARFSEPVNSVRKALALVKKGKISLLEYVYFSGLVASRFRVDPSLVVQSLREYSDGKLELVLRPNPPLIPRYVAIRLLSCVNNLVRVCGYKEVAGDTARMKNSRITSLSGGSWKSCNGKLMPC